MMCGMRSSSIDIDRTRMDVGNTHRPRAIQPDLFSCGSGYIFQITPVVELSAPANTFKVY
jgi:hypothetical protein